MIETPQHFHNANERAMRAVELDMYRPRNLAKEVFLASPDLEYVAGPFSTFDITLARMIHAHVPQRDINSYIIGHLKNLSGIAAEYVYQILIAVKDLKLADKLARLTVNTPTQIVQTLFQTLAHKVQYQMSLGHHNLTIWVVNSWADVPGVFVPSPEHRDGTFGLYTQHLFDKTDGRTHNYILLHRGNIVTNKADLYRGIMQTFAHEFSHFVDTVSPNRGALGAQVMSYPSDAATEFCAHTTGKIMERYLADTQR